MSTGFSFGQKPNETPTFGQASFGTPQFASPAATTAQSQLSSAFGAKPSTGSFQFSSPTSTPAFGASFNFNATTTQNVPPSTSSFGFPVTTPSTFGLGTTTTGLSFPISNTAPQTTSLFGTMPASTLTLGKTIAPTFGTSTGGLFGNVAPTSSATQPASFGIPTSTSLLTSTGVPTNTSFSFGTSQSMAPTTFASSAPAGLLLGSAIPTGPSTGLSFGTTTSSVPTTKFTFGPTTAAAAPSINFGAIQSTPTTSLSFQPTSTSMPQTSLTYEIPSSGVPLFGISSATPATVGPSLAIPSTSTQKISFTSAPPTFGVSTGPSTGLTFSTASSTPTPALNFLAPAVTIPSLGLGSSTPSLGLGAVTTAAVTTAGTTAGLNFLTSVPSTTSGSFSTAATLASAAVTSSTAPTLSFGTAPTATINFGATTTTSAPVLNFAASLATTTAPTNVLGTTSVGLGGIKQTTTATAIQSGGTLKPTDLTSSKQTSNQTIAASPKDQVLPNEIMQTVENFKKFVKEQKGFSSEVSRFSMKDLRKLELHVDFINNSMNEVENQLKKNKAMVDNLKMDTAKDLKHVEMAQRTFDTPAGFQYENTAPFNYFVELSDKFETEMHDLKIHIENVAKYIRNSSAATTLSPEDLALGMRRLHVSFVTLAGRLQSVHSQVELQKEQYLNIRKKMLNDYSNVFEKQSKESDALELLLGKLAKQQPAISNSPTPFTSLRSSQVQAVGQNNATTTYPAVPGLGVPLTTGFNIGGAPNMTLFGGNTTNNPSLFNTSTSTSFQLQKPPVGNKRGKP